MANALDLYFPNRNGMFLAKEEFFLQPVKDALVIENPFWHGLQLIVIQVLTNNHKNPIKLFSLISFIQ